MKKKYSIQEGIDALEKIKLLMTYDLSKTLTENETKGEYFYFPERDSKNNIIRYRLANTEYYTKPSYNIPGTPSSAKELKYQLPTMDSYWAKDIFPGPKISYPNYVDVLTVGNVVKKNKTKTYGEQTMDNYNQQNKEKLKYQTQDNTVLKPKQSFNFNLSSQEEKYVSDWEKKIKLNVPNFDIPLGRRDTGKKLYYFDIENLSNEIITIQNIEIENKSSDKFNYFRLPDNTRKKYNLFPDKIKKEEIFFYPALRTNVSNEYINITDSNEINFDLNVITNLGKITYNYKTKQINYEDEFNQKIRTTKQNVLNRKTPILKIGVPEGFSPFNYEEFIKEIYEKIIKNQGCSKERVDKLYKKYFIDEKSKNLFPYLNIKFRPSKINYENVNACPTSLLAGLEKKYYDKKFPTGVTPEDKEEFYNSYNSALAELNSFKERHKVQRNREPFDFYFSESALSETDKKKYKELVDKVQSIKTEFAYDDRNKFDKFWEEYGLWIQIGVGVLSAIATLGASSPASAALIASAIGAETATVITALNSVARLSTLADFYMNAAVGTYQLGKGETKEAMLSFFFAALPKIHNLYSKVGKLFGTPSANVAKSLAEKVARVKLESRVDVNAFILTLKEPEKIYFRKALKLGQEDWKNIWNLVEEDMKSSLKLPAGKVAGNVAKGVGKFAATVVIDFTAIHTAQELYEKSINFINKYCKNCFKTEKEKRMAKTYLNSLSPKQLKVLTFYLDAIQRDATLTNQLKAEKTKKAIVGEIKEVIKNMEIKIDLLPEEEIRKLMQIEIQNMESGN